jgi:hypothetical protein
MCIHYLKRLRQLLFEQHECTNCTTEKLPLKPLIGYLHQQHGTDKEIIPHYCHCPEDKRPLLCNADGAKPNANV